ncbi:thiol reductant ABC exporter subunit CydD [Wenzhouxiangella marina]|uniref:ABC transporter ATP-binding protein n=1 Tax=Wenzhouxiangella marina TaxID=1579979 RepID=A0A0K0XVW6_9GAMM|nr:thiol reductant ABC exporter subunit CydD [Wenzhouxiangella marina]AKS41767.1 ABC transporter ATP-binding protein [Wenzhouxiangella marina]MBB6086471.1 ATP-binding cassette subfamily C protein CydD [Wenzhouxiangella marina]
MATGTEPAPASELSSWLAAQAPGWLRPLAWLAALLEAGLLIAQALLIAGIFEGVLVSGEGFDSQWPALGILLAMLIGRASITGARAALADTASGRTRQRLRRALFEQQADAGPVDSAGEAAGALAHRIVDRVDHLDAYYSRFLPQRASALLIPLSIALVVASIDWLAALLLAITAPIIPLFMALIGRGAQSLSEAQAESTARLSGLFYDRLKGLATIRRLGAGPRVIEWLAEHAQEYRARTLRVLRLAFLSSAVLEFFAAVAIASLAIYIGLSLLGYVELGPSAQLTLGGGLAILLLAPDFFLPLRQLAQHWHDRADALAAAAELRAMLDRPRPARPSTSSRTAEPSRAPNDDELELDHVSFAYPGRPPLLSGLSLKVRAGERVLIRGPSGVGKSTLLMLMAGFLSPREGQVRYRGRDIADLDDQARSRWRAWMNQNSVLFDESLRWNLTLGRVGIPDSRLHECLALAGLADLPDALDQGFETTLGERGCRLSGGQARRLVLARILLEARPLLLLDEPSEHLDPGSETALWKAIDLATRSQGLTVIAVSHRPAAERWASRVIDLPFDEQGNAS